MKHRCENCKTLLYETRSDGSGFESVVTVGWVESERAGGLPPIVVDVGRKFRVMFCSRMCAARWFLASDESSLRSGYPVL